MPRLTHCRESDAELRLRPEKMQKSLGRRTAQCSPAPLFRVGAQAFSPLSNPTQNFEERKQLTGEGISGPSANRVALGWAQPWMGTRMTADVPLLQGKHPTFPTYHILSGSVHVGKLVPEILMLLMAQKDDDENGGNLRNQELM